MYAVKNRSPSPRLALAKSFSLPCSVCTHVEQQDCRVGVVAHISLFNDSTGDLFLGGTQNVDAFPNGIVKRLEIKINKKKKKATSDGVPAHRRQREFSNSDRPADIL